MLAAAQSFRICEILNRHFKNEADAKAVVTEIETVIENKFADGKANLTTKEDLAKLEGKLDTRISESKADIIKWMSLFWIGQIGATIGIILVFLKK